MSEPKPARKTPPKKPRRATAGGNPGDGFAEEERAAMRERAQELKDAKRPSKGDESEEQSVLAKIAEMSAADRAMAERLHTLIRAVAPGLAPRLWYGMPAYAVDGKIVCFFQCAQKFKTRYATLGFSDKAALDEGSMWPTAFALKELDSAAEKRIGDLVKRAVKTT